MPEIEHCPSDNAAQEDSKMQRASTCVRCILDQVRLPEARVRLQAAVAWWRSLNIH